MSPLKLDSFLERQTEKFCHGLQRWTGISSYLLAHFLTGTWVISLCFFVAARFFDFPETQRPTWVDVVLTSYLITNGVILLKRTRIAHDKLVSGSLALPSWLIAFRDQFSVYYRLVCLGIITLEIFVAFMIRVPRYWPLHYLRTAGFISFSACQYVLLVNPLPPGTSKVREFLNSFRPVGVPVQS